MKLVVDAKTDRVLGVHMVGPDAGEIVQGMAVALKAGATKAGVRRHHRHPSDRCRGIRDDAHGGGVAESGQPTAGDKADGLAARRARARQKNACSDTDFRYRRRFLISRARRHPPCPIPPTS